MPPEEIAFIFKGVVLIIALFGGILSQFYLAWKSRERQNKAFKVQREANQKLLKELEGRL